MSEDNILGDVKYVLLTGNEPYDRLVGGFPFGRISEVFGMENCGKTAMMVRSMCRFNANHIYEVVDKQGFIYTVRKVDPEKVVTIACYVDNEHSLESGFKITITDTSIDEQGQEVEQRITMRTSLMVADTVEQIFEAIEKFIAKIKEAEKIIEEEGSDRLVFGLFIVDTIAGTSSKEELERPWGDRDYPRQAQEISLGFRCLNNEISRHNVAAIFTNQVRVKFKDLQRGSGYRARFNTPQADDFSTFGGRALACYATHRVFMFQVPVKYALAKGAQFPAGYLVGFRTVKNRLRKPGREGRMVLLFDEDQGGLHNILSILDSLIFLRMAEYHDDGGISFKFRKHRIPTTTFAENVTLDEEDTRKRQRDPRIDGRYEWPSFYRAHRGDLDKLWDAAVLKANSTEGLSEFYDPEDEEGVDEETPPPSRRRRGGPMTVSALEEDV
jgi:RecA/RadA recombinase